MKKSASPCLTARILAAGLATLLPTPALFAVTDTWDGGGADNNLSTGLNWLDNTAPASDLALTDLIFAGAVRLTPNVSVVFSTNSIVFNNTAGAFVIGGSTLNVGAGGITNNDADTQAFTNTINLVGTATTTFSATSGALSFGAVALGANTLNFAATTGTSSLTALTGSGTLNKSGAGTLTFGAAGAVTQAWDLVESAGSFTVNAATDLTVSTTGSITVSGATFNANGNVTMDATPFLLSGGGSFLTVASGKTLTVQNGGSLAASGSGTIVHNTAGTITVTGSGSLLNAGSNNIVVNGSGSTLNVLAGADATCVFLTVGGSGAATVLFDGTGTTLTASSTAAIGNGAGASTVTFSNGAAGALARIDLGRFANNNGQLSILSGAMVTASSLVMGETSLATATGTLTVNGAGSSFTINAAGTANIGAASLSTAAVNVQNSGVFNTGTGLTTLNTTGGISITGGTFNANGNITLNGGDLSRDAGGVFTVASGRTFTVGNGSAATFAGAQSFVGANLNVIGASSALTTISGGVNIIGAAIVEVTAGGHLDAFTTVGIANSGAGTSIISVDGAGSQISGSSGTNVWGANGGVANVTLGNNAVGNFNATLQLGSSATAGSVGTVLVQSGADMTTGQLLIGNTAAASTRGAVTVTGAGSTWTILGANFLGIGAASGSTGSLTVASGGVFNSGTGNSVVNVTGTLAIAGGTFVANGGLTIIGGQFTRDATGTFTLPATRVLTVQSGGDAIFTGDFVNTTASFVTVIGAGSTFTATGALLQFNGGTTVNVSMGGSVSGGAVSIGTLGNGTVTVDGSGSSFSGGNLGIGGQSAGLLTFSNGSTGAFGTIALSDIILPGGNGTLNIQSGSTVTGTGLSLSPTAVAQPGLVSITGAGSVLTLTGAATTSIGAASANTATLDVLNGGAFTSGTGLVTLNATGVINIDTGTVNLAGPLVRNGGVINFLSGSLSIVSNWNVGPGGLLGTNVTFDSTRQFATTGTTTIDAFRTLTLNGGVLSTGALVNNGALAFNSGTLAITGAGGFNIGTGALGSNVTLGTGANLQVTNTATVASAGTLSVDGGSATLGTLNNSGLVEHVRGLLTITGAATNLTGADFFAAKPLTVVGVFTNQSGARLTLQNGTGRINGLGSVTNAGLITGDGVIAVGVTNIGSGSIRAESGKTLYFTGTAAANAGNFILQGGTLDFTNAVTNNATGFISGHGALNTGGLTNSGQMAFSGGNTDIRGDTTLTAGSRVVTSGGGAVTTFFDDVVHNGLEIFTGVNASTVFFGSQSGAGSFTGTGTVYFIGDLRPGNSPALITFGGDVVYGSLNTVTMELGGTTRGTQYDALNVAGKLTFGGTLTVPLISAFQPQAGHVFNLFDFGTHAGTFSTVNLPALNPGLLWSQANLYTAGEIQVALDPVFVSRTWDGGGANNNWITDANWTLDVQPLNNATADLIFTGNVRLTPSVDTAWNVRSITFNNAAGAFTITGPQGITVGAGGIVNNDADAQTVTAALTLGANQTFDAAAGALSVGSVALSGRTLTIAGAANTTVGGASGAGTVTKTGAGTLAVNGALGAGAVTFNANAGAVQIKASQTLAALVIANGVEVTFGDGLPLVGTPDKFGAPALVPEPGALGLLMAGALGWLARRRAVSGARAD